LEPWSSILEAGAPRRQGVLDGVITLNLKYIIWALFLAVLIILFIFSFLVTLPLLGSYICS
jgi:hypothetical protein